ncbi:signal transduction histidine kinase [Krasilnikovia cinnamomea]|uniref:histidine kinase n=1 Tax=Krasilnikovia cinnamomea TaxID=349313 RepID=A0A4V2G711_9ACTN|nr:nitrate- and nitrite sensing domain-containing protein [Krasilnikovia cinnamomea]RZU50756.1 signal transduction histidine kinase [Krasilnikovia cinnamomea]
MFFGSLRMRGKLALLILVPLLGVVGLSVPIIADRITVARDAQKVAEVVALAVEVGTAVQELQEERLLSVGYFYGLVPLPELSVQSAKARDRVQQLRGLSKDLPLGLRRAIANLSKLDNTRLNVRNRAIPPEVIVAEYTTVIQQVFVQLGLSQIADLTTATGRQVFALDQALRTDELISQIAGYLVPAVITKQQSVLGRFSVAFVQLQQVFANSQPYFTPAQYKLYIGARESFLTRLGPAFFQYGTTDPLTAAKSLNIKTLFPSLRSISVIGGFMEKRIAADVTTAVTQTRQDAIGTAYSVGGGTLVMFVVVVGLSILMAGAVARPLRHLTASADRVAREAEAELQRVADDDTDHVRPIRLDEVDVAGRDEIGDLARAFDRVQTTAARLVERQAVGRRNVAQMFGHVGRRTQNLVGRQLALIDSLERRETDTERLRELYRLDHLSSRLRRNAGSLVVLSGGAGANEHMAPLALSDVVRLALGEIEDYTRVDLEIPEEIVVVPSLVADLTLILAELMENATSFSPPHTRVSATATELRGGARLAIVDHGLGLSPERMTEENARLTRRERLDLAPTEVLGLFVVGRLARRHGIEVTLTETPNGGVTAWLDLEPAHLITHAEAVPAAPIQASVVGHHTTELPTLIAGAAGRHAPGSTQPFDANKLNRATETIEAALTWNAFALAASPVAIEAGFHRHEPDRYVDDTVYDAEPVPDHQPRTHGYDLGVPIAGRHPAALPELEGRLVQPAQTEMVLPRQRQPERPVPQALAGPAQLPSPHALAGPPSLPAPSAAPASPAPDLPRGGGAAPLRRRVPGSHMPTETGPTPRTAPPTSDDALAARDALADFEAGVARAQWDVIEADVAAPPAVEYPPPGANQPPPAASPSAFGGSPPPASPPPFGASEPSFGQPSYGGSQPSFGQPSYGGGQPSYGASQPAPAASPPPPSTGGNPPLARRVPGASLPVTSPPNQAPPASPVQPLDPEAARALIEQFEHGVASALNETQPQHEGQPR